MKNNVKQSKAERADLMRYSFYSNGRGTAAKPTKPVKKVKAKHHSHLRRNFILLLIAVIGVSAYAFLQPSKADTGQTNSVIKAVSTKKAVPAVVATNYCAGNTLDQLVKVSISLRHMWACDGDTTAYNSPVVTGIEYLAADRTPVGTYHIYGKLTDQILTGSDTTGSWRDPVSYWMPFLDNQYGAYGFHDATWRANNAFGNISPNSSDASHGCVELPLATAAWLYNWAVVGTTVSIVS